jgi:hypothetical protein
MARKLQASNIGRASKQASKQASEQSIKQLEGWLADISSLQKLKHKPCK